MARFTSYVELALGADLTGIPSTWSWTDISPYAHQPSGIVIQRGRPDWYSQTPPARCNLTLINNGGRFTPRNPTGPYHGSLGRNTPLRVLLVPNINSLSDGFNRTSSSSWGSADVGGAWTNAGGSASDFSVSPTNGGRHTHTSATSPHYSTVSISILRYDVRVRVKTAALATGAALTAAVAARFQSTSATDRYELQFNTDQTMTGRLVQRTGGVDAVNASATISGLTHAAGTWYWIRAQSGYTAARLKVWQDGDEEPTTWNIDGSDGFLGNPAAGAIGLYSIRETGNTNANATIDFDTMSMVDGPRIQYTGYVDEWPTTWADASGTLSFAPVTCSGILRRLQQGQVLKSALYRAHTQGYYSSGTAVAYWPCEDGSNADSLASGIGGPPILIAGDNSLASDSTIKGSDPLPVVADNSIWVGSVPTYTTATSWAIRWVMKIPSAPSGGQTLLRWHTAGSLYIWQLVLTPGGGTDFIALQAYNSALVEQLADSGVNFADAVTGAELYGRQLYFEVNATQNGTAIDWDYNVWYGTSGVGKVGSEASATIGNVTSARFGVGNGAADLGGATLGHIAVSTDVDFGAGADGATGAAGERTDTRFVRLAAEENIPTVFGELLNQVVSDQTMGAQPTASLVNQLREVEAAEEGVLHDGKQGQVTILARSLRYNRAVELALDVDTGTVGWPFEVRDDDQRLRNDITVSQPSGTSARSTQTTGPLAVTAVGVYSDSVTINADADLQLHADWRRHLGTVEDPRYPQIELNLTRNPTLADDWCDADIGSRLQIAHPPAELPPDTIDLHIEGYTEVFDGVEWKAVVNTSPATPWQVFTLEDNTLGRLETSGSYLLTSATAGATSLLVATYSDPPGPQWSTTAEPYDWHVSGERITVTTMTSNTATFVNAGAASHGDNASLTPALPASVQQGDLLLVFCAIRNTAATSSAPSGYTQLWSFANVALYGKIHTGTESAPTVTFSGGSAGDTTSAQMAAFRNVQAQVHGQVAQANTAQQHIPFGAITGLDRANLLLLYLGWKQDDWTSVTQLATGTEIGDTSTTTGNDQGIVWDYQLLTAPVPNAAGNFNVNGGANAVSVGAVVALVTDVQTATVTRAVNGVSKAQAAGAGVSLWKPGSGGLAL